VLKLHDRSDIYSTVSRPGYYTASEVNLITTRARERKPKERTG